TPVVPFGPLVASPVALGLDLFVVGYGLGLLLSAQMRQARLASHVVVAAIVNLLLNLALVPRYGAPAAALTTAASYAIYLLLNATALRANGLFDDIQA